jgi:hypothetical protein
LESKSSNRPSSAVAERAAGKRTEIVCAETTAIHTRLAASTDKIREVRMPKYR